MTIQRLTENLYIAPQLTEETAAQATELGIRSVICNRPDQEEAGQADTASVKQWLAANGINEFSHQPVTAPNVSLEDAAEFARLIEQQSTPVLAYCRTGTRCTLLWAGHAVQHGLPVADAISQAAQIGINLQPFEAKLNSFVQAAE